MQQEGFEENVSHEISCQTVLIQPENTLNSPRLHGYQYNSANVVGKRIYLFGGLSSGSGANMGLRHHFIYVLDFEEKTWRRPIVRGDLPEGRSMHTSTLIDDSLYICGGYSNSLDSLNDFFRFDLVTEEWQKLERYGQAPNGCHGHSACRFQQGVIGEIIVMMGKSGSHISNNVYALEVSSLMWHLLKPKGEMPAPRFQHAAVLFDSRMYVFGGRSIGRVNEVYSDLHVLDLQTSSSLVWSSVKTSTSPMARFQASLVGQDKLVLLGGLDVRSVESFWIFDPEEVEWIGFRGLNKSQSKIVLASGNQLPNIGVNSSVFIRDRLVCFTGAGDYDYCEIVFAR